MIKEIVAGLQQSLLFYGLIPGQPLLLLKGKTDHLKKIL
jgi:hypothetical protein